MSFNFGWRGPNIVKDGLLIYLDASSPNSYYDTTSTTWKDISGNNKDGTLTNGPTYNSNDGGSIVFDGVNDYVTISGSTSFPDKGSLVFWVNPSVVENYRNPLSLWTLNGLNEGIRFEENNSGTFGAVVGSGSFTFTPHNYVTTGFTANQWYMVSLTWDVTNNRVSGTLNGSQKFTNSTNTTWPTTIPQINLGTGYDISRSWLGRISNFMLYNKELSFDEVTQNYNSLKGKYGL